MQKLNIKLTNNKLHKITKKAHRNITNKKVTFNEDFEKIGRRIEIYGK